MTQPRTPEHRRDAAITQALWITGRMADARTNDAVRDMAEALRQAATEWERAATLVLWKKGIAQ